MISPVHRLTGGALTAFRARRRDKVLLVEALVALITASAMTYVLPFRRVAAASARPLQHAKSLSTDQRRAEARRIRWALTAWSKRVPWRAVCYQQGVAAQRMLRRRGIAATLYYGVAKEDSGELLAHVWVKDGEIDVIGCENVSRYGVLATFPNPQNSPASVNYSLDQRDILS